MQNLSKKDFILQYALEARRSGRAVDVADDVMPSHEAKKNREELVKAAAHIYELAHKEANKDA